MSTQRACSITKFRGRLWGLCRCNHWRRVKLKIICWMNYREHWNQYKSKKRKIIHFSLLMLKTILIHEHPEFLSRHADFRVWKNVKTSKIGILLINNFIFKTRYNITYTKIKQSNWYFLYNGVKRKVAFLLFNYKITLREKILIGFGSITMR